MSYDKRNKKNVIKQKMCYKKEAPYEAAVSTGI
jgi:hypothetical protein